MKDLFVVLIIFTVNLVTTQPYPNRKVKWHTNEYEFPRNVSFILFLLYLFMLAREIKIWKTVLSYKSDVQCAGFLII